MLTDHGVAAAIRSYARRMPVDVNMVIAPQAAGRRWTPGVETALYFDPAGVTRRSGLQHMADRMAALGERCS